MKYSYEIRHAGEITYIDMKGIITKETIWKILEKVWQKKEDEHECLLWDFRSCILGFWPTKLKELRRFVVEHGERKTCRKVAFVIEKDLHFGLLKIYKTSVGELSFDIQAFRDVGLAREWLHAE